MAMVFATLADMLALFEESELVQLTDVAGNGAIDEARVDQVLVSASALVSGYVSATYTLDPAAAVPQLLVDVTCDLARYRLYRTSPPEDVRDRNNQAVRTLQSIRAGTIKLDGGTEQLEARPGKIVLQAGVRRMSREQMEGY